MATESDRYWKGAYSLIASVSRPTLSVGVPADE
jgi:hypothetical protein